MKGTILLETIFLLTLCFFDKAFLKHLTRVIYLERIEYTLCRKEFSTCHFTLDPSPRNRFAKVTNFNMTVFHRMIAKDFYVEGMLMKQSGNEYKRTAFYYKKNYCTFLDNEFKAFLKFDSDPAFDEFHLTCPYLEAETFLIRNYTLDTSGFTSVVQMLPLWTMKFLFSIGGCPVSDVFKGGNWGDTGDMCFRTAVIFSLREV